jgi:hypothetical protein|tara:strand:+ start:26833 stop:27012 length:180 start_codon:yes stop_codon:yes gene_type:complete
MSTKLMVPRPRRDATASHVDAMMTTTTTSATTTTARATTRARVAGKVRKENTCARSRAG